MRTVLSVALLALARKLIILDPHEYPASTIFALAALIVAVGVASWLIRHRDARPLAARGRRERLEEYIPAKAAARPADDCPFVDC